MIRFLFAVALSFVAFGAAAQSTLYSCRTSNGSYMSTRPCPSDPGAGNGAAKISGTASVESVQASRNWRPPQSSPVYMPQAAEKHLEYLSPRCAEISEAMRTGASRGVRSDVLVGLYKEYSDKCAEEDSAARRQLSERTSAERDKRQSELRVASAAKEQSKLEHDQCQELLRILVGKRKRIEAMTDGEKQDLQRFNDTYQARCGKR
jgi:hypothetical protein